MIGGVKMVNVITICDATNIKNDSFVWIEIETSKNAFLFFIKSEDPYLAFSILINELRPTKCFVLERDCSDYVLELNDDFKEFGFLKSREFDLGSNCFDFAKLFRAIYESDIPVKLQLFFGNDKKMASVYVNYYNENMSILLPTSLLTNEYINKCKQKLPKWKFKIRCKFIL